MNRRNVQKVKLYAVAENREKNPIFPSVALRSPGRFLFPACLASVVSAIHHSDFLSPAFVFPVIKSLLGSNLKMSTVSVTGCLNLYATDCS